jgi:hypothetical protein
MENLLEPSTDRLQQPVASGEVESALSRESEALA